MRPTLSDPEAPIDDWRAIARRGVMAVGFSVWRFAGKSWLGAIATTARSPALYVSNGLNDRYGNFEGCERLAILARLRGVQTEWRSRYADTASPS